MIDLRAVAEALVRLRHLLLCVVVRVVELRGDVRRLERSLQRGSVVVHPANRGRGVGHEDADVSTRGLLADAGRGTGDGGDRGHARPRSAPPTYEMFSSLALSFGLSSSRHSSPLGRLCRTRGHLLSRSGSRQRRQARRSKPLGVRDHERECAQHLGPLAQHARPARRPPRPRPEARTGRLPRGCPRAAARPRRSGRRRR